MVAGLAENFVPTRSHADLDTHNEVEIEQDMFRRREHKRGGEC